MVVKFKHPVRIANEVFSPGQESEVEDKLATRLVTVGLAEAVKPAKKVAKKNGKGRP